MESIEIEGASLEEAVERACDALNTTVENLSYEILSETKEGKRGRIKILAKKREEGSLADLSSFAGRARGLLEEMLKLVDPSYSVVAFEYPDKLVLNIKGDGSGLLIGKRGQTLDAIQHILLKMIQKIEGKEETKKVMVDTEKYREKRMDYLKSLAKKLAEKAKRTGRPVAVNPMSSFERRIVHLALEKEEGVYTESTGEGSERKVMIIPKNQNKSSKMGYNRRKYDNGME